MRSGTRQARRTVDQRRAETRQQDGADGAETGEVAQENRAPRTGPCRARKTGYWLAARKHRTPAGRRRRGHGPGRTGIPSTPWEIRARRSNTRRSNEEERIDRTHRTPPQKEEVVQGRQDAEGQPAIHR
jgi:hypothetical protein